MRPLTACKISVSLWFLNWDKNEMIFYRISELMLPTLIQRYDKKKIISFLSWISKKKCKKFLRNMESIMKIDSMYIHTNFR